MNIRLFPILIMLFAIVSCGRPGDKAEGHQLTVSIEPQRYLLEQIAGPKWRVSTLMSRGEDPENFDPSMATLRDLQSSAAYFKVGTLAFENEIIDRAGRNVNVVDSGCGISLLEGTHGECHNSEHHHSDGENHEHETDPHIWASIPNLKIMAKNMLTEIIELDPAGSTVYQSNYNKLVLHLDSCQAAINHILSGSGRIVFMVWHPSLSYFARDYNLEQMSIGMANKEMSVMSFRKRIDEARRQGAHLFLLQPDFDAGRSASIASAAGAVSETVNTLSYDLPSELVRISKLIKSDR